MEQKKVRWYRKMTWWQFFCLAFILFLLDGVDRSLEAGFLTFAGFVSLCFGFAAVIRFFYKKMKVWHLLSAWLVFDGINYLLLHSRKFMELVYFLEHFKLFGVFPIPATDVMLIAVFYAGWTPFAALSGLSFIMAVILGANNWAKKRNIKST